VKTSNLTRSLFQFKRVLVLLSEDPFMSAFARLSPLNETYPDVNLYAIKQETKSGILPFRHVQREQKKLGFCYWVNTGQVEAR
jgi:hypothetical protein